jgi:acyl-lipid omega-6 desaturase (Delta-12 desaturase)
LTLILTEAHPDAAFRQQPVGDEGEPRTRIADVLARRPAPSAAEELGAILLRRFKAYRADWKRSVLQLIVTLPPFLVLLAVIGVMSVEHYWVSLLLAIPAAGLLVRLFIFQHDCGHGSFFKSRAANDWVGRAISVLTLTPYGQWKQGHAIHHASAGNLDRRGRGDVEMMTVAEYQALSPRGKLGYRLYRNPIVQVLIGAPLNFIVLQRIPRGRSFRDRTERTSMLALNAALLVVFGLPMAIFGVGPVLATYLPVMIVAAWIGNWLFFVQHQFDDTYWQRDESWNFHASALQGSSYFRLPSILRWFSGNIGLHHIHHLSSRVPNYHLQACFDQAPELSGIAKRITLRESVGCWRLALWDEQRCRMVAFSELTLGAAPLPA